jgi:hypothetical protein
MTERRPRRIVRRAVMAVAGIVLLLAGYVGSYGYMRWLHGREEIDSRSAAMFYATSYAPLRLYERSGLPWSKHLRRFGAWCYWKGGGMSYKWQYVEESP